MNTKLCLESSISSIPGVKCSLSVQAQESASCPTGSIKTTHVRVSSIILPQVGSLIFSNDVVLGDKSQWQCTRRKSPENLLECLATKVLAGERKLYSPIASITHIEHYVVRCFMRFKCKRK
ncbi:hypothetical protein GCK32_011830 [Trichostrongylus colubriformis]|uniref:Uncharacterized protein n=1 Tax=Trichostrongylus colubriformis TaxID=6319 RepID=A0AAN8ITE1_TRICO